MLEGTDLFSEPGDPKWWLRLPRAGRSFSISTNDYGQAWRTAARRRSRQQL